MFNLSTYGSSGRLVESLTMSNMINQQDSSLKLTESSLSLNALDVKPKEKYTEKSNLLCNKQFSASYDKSTTKSESQHILYSPIVDVKMQFILIGDKSVGKTCFLQRYADDMFTQKSTSTVGIDFKQKIVSFPGHKIRLHIWDTAGQERFNSITTAYYRNARGVILFYDVTNRRSYENLIKWLTLVRKYANDDAVLAIVGNKCDIGTQQVDSNEAKQFAASNVHLFYEASAKESSNVENVFNDLVKEVLKQMPILHDPCPSRLKRKRMVILRPLTEEKNKFWCCANN